MEFLRELSMSFNQGALDLTTGLGLEAGEEVMTLSVVTLVRFLGTSPRVFHYIDQAMF